MNLLSLFRFAILFYVLLSVRNFTVDQKVSVAIMLCVVFYHHTRVLTAMHILLVFCVTQGICDGEGFRRHDQMCLSEQNKIARWTLCEGLCI